MVTAKCVAELVCDHDGVPDDLRVSQTEVALNVCTDAIGNAGAVERIEVGDSASKVGTAQQVHVVAWQVAGVPARAQLLKCASGGAESPRVGRGAVNENLLDVESRADFGLVPGADVGEQVSDVVDRCAGVAEFLEEWVVCFDVQIGPARGQGFSGQAVGVDGVLQLLAQCK